MQVKPQEVSADKATTPRYDTIVICGATGNTVPKKVDGGEVVAWAMGHGLAAMDALEEFVDDLAAGNCNQPSHLTQAAASAINLMRRRNAIGWEADEPTRQQPADWKSAVADAVATARRVFGESNDDAMQAIHYVEGLMLANEPKDWKAPFDLHEFARRADQEMQKHDFHGFEPVVLAVAEGLLEAPGSAHGGEA